MGPARWGGLARGLFALGCGLGGLLLALVLLAPLADSGDPPRDGWQRVVSLFARDAALRRTSLASACGLVVSACVFFRPARRGGGPALPLAARRRPPSAGGAGA
jgi:hypothetical protein